MPIFVNVFVHSIEKVFCLEGLCMNGWRGSHRKVAQVSAMTKEPDTCPHPRLIAILTMHVNLFGCYCFLGPSSASI